MDGGLDRFMRSTDRARHRGARRRGCRRRGARRHPQARIGRGQNQRRAAHARGRGASMALDDVDGIALLGVPPYALGRWSAFVKRAFDLVAGSIMSVLSPRSSPWWPSQSGWTPRPGVLPPAANGQGRQALPHVQVPDDAHGRRGDEGRPPGPERGGRPVQDRQRPPGDRRGTPPSQVVDRRARSARRRRPWEDEPGGATASGDRRGSPVRGLAAVGATTSAPGSPGRGRSWGPRASPSKRWSSSTTFTARTGPSGAT